MPPRPSSGGKYCKEEGLMHCKEINSSSHGWRGILIGRDLLDKQLGWAVGNGEDIKVWDDNWLSTTCKAAPMGPATELTKDLKVKDMFLPNSTCWDEVKVKNLIPQAAQAVLNINPSKKGAKDSLIWLKDKTGSYTTKSGYHVAAQDDQILTIQNGSTTVQWIPDVWALKTAPKIKLFIWKALHGALPVGERLLSRKINITPTCKKCGELETVTHLLLHCEFAQQVWRTAPFASLFDPKSFNTFAEGGRFLKNLQCLPPSGISSTQLAPWICWSIWKERNNRVFNSNCFSVAETVTKSISDTKEWLEAQARTNLDSRRRLAELPIPPRGSIFCKTDGAWKGELEPAGIGWTFELPNNTTLSKHSKTLMHVKSALSSEALAIREAMEMALERGFKKVLFQSDCLQLVTILSSGSSISKEYGVVADIYDLSLSFEFLLFTFIPRSANSVADGLAKWALLNQALNL